MSELDEIRARSTKSWGGSFKRAAADVDALLAALTEAEHRAERAEGREMVLREALEWIEATYGSTVARRALEDTSDVAHATDGPGGTG